MTGPRPLPTMTQEHEDELRLLAWDARAEGNMVQHKLLVETADFIEASLAGPVVPDVSDPDDPLGFDGTEDGEAISVNRTTEREQ